MNNNLSYDVTFMPIELRLLLDIMKMENVDSNVLYNSYCYTDIDWDFFLELANHHRVYPLIYSRLIKVDKVFFPNSVIQLLHKEYQKNTFKMLHLSGEMEQLSKLFCENKIRLLFLKGPAMAADIYGDISLRTSKDLDILISINDLTRAEEVLLDLGYQKEGFPATFANWKWMFHHVSFYHPIKGIQIEIHWRLHSPPNKEPTFNELWERKKISLLTTFPVYLLGKEDLLLYLIVHGSSHGWFRLRWLADIDHIIRNGIMLNKSILSKKGHPNYDVVGQALILTSQLLKTPINEEIKSFTREKRSMNLAKLAITYITEMSYLHIKPSKVDMNKVPRHKFFSTKSNLQKSLYVNRSLFSMMSFLQKVYYVIRFLFPSPADTDIMKLPKFLHILYFPLHPFLWIWRKAKKIP